MISKSVAHTLCPASDPQKTNLNGIDLVKFLCAIMVFIIHFPPFVSDASEFARTANFIIQHGICRVAVPFYFVCSGFFLFQKMPLDALNADIIKNYCYKLLRLFGFWTLILIVGTCDQLWYLSATVIAIVLLSLCLHFRLKRRLIWLLACLLYAVGLLGDSYHGLIAPLLETSVLGKIYDAYAKLFGTTRNGVFMGFIFVLLGASLAERKISIKPRIAAVGFALSFVVLLAEALLLDHYNIPFEYNMYISLLPAVYFLFCFAYTIPLKGGSVYKHLRNIGMWIYFLHKSIGRIVYVAERTLGYFCNIGIFSHLFVLVLPATLLVCIFLDWLSGKDRFKWLNWLIA